jgi:hypothetical protein
VGVFEAASSGDRIATLVALRDHLALQIDEAKYAKDASPLADRLMKVLAEIAELAPPEKKGTALDQLAERRRARGATTKGLDAAEGSPGPR